MIECPPHTLCIPYVDMLMTAVGFGLAVLTIWLYRWWTKPKPKLPIANCEHCGKPLLEVDQQEIWTARR